MIECTVFKKQKPFIVPCGHLLRVTQVDRLFTHFVYLNHITNTQNHTFQDFTCMVIYCTYNNKINALIIEQQMSIKCIREHDKTLKVRLLKRMQ